MAVGVFIAVVLILVFGIKGCLSARKERAFKDYVRNAAADIQESNQESSALFALLRQPAPNQGPVEIENTVNGFRTEAARLAERVDSLSHPGQLKTAQRYLVEALGFRRDGIAAIARLLPTALGDKGRSQATAQMAAQMQTFLASDVLVSQRFVPELYRVLKKEHLDDDVPVPEAIRAPKGFLPNIDWLSPTTVADRVAGIRGGGTAAVAPGLHGTGLIGVSAQPSGQTLSPSTATDIKLATGLTFNVQVQDQGQNTERDVTVRVSITGAGKPIALEDSIPTISAGETKTVSIPLSATPPTGRAVTIKVDVAPVPGETKTDNNKASYPAIFTH